MFSRLVKAPVSPDDQDSVVSSLILHVKLRCALGNYLHHEVQRLSCSDIMYKLLAVQVPGSEPKATRTRAAALRALLKLGVGTIQLLASTSVVSGCSDAQRGGCWKKSTSDDL